MNLPLKSTRHEYFFTHENGYNFTVTAVYDPEFGWSAHVAMGADGHRTPEDAIRHLALSSAEFTKRVQEAE